MIDSNLYLHKTSQRSFFKIRTNDKNFIRYDKQCYLLRAGPYFALFFTSRTPITINKVKKYNRSSKHNKKYDILVPDMLPLAFFIQLY